jgi:hypothetical protein
MRNPWDIIFIHITLLPYQFDLYITTHILLSGEYSYIYTKIFSE